MAMTDGEGLEIRTASLADASDLAGVHVASWRETYVGMVPEAMLSALSVDSRTAMWERILGERTTGRSTAVYVADIGGKVVGFASCGAQRTTALAERGYDAEVSAIYVLRDFQRRAIGTRLLFATAADLSRMGFGALSLWVLRGNRPARRFYERYGGRVIAEREDVEGETVFLEVAYGWSNLAELARLTGE